MEEGQTNKKIIPPATSGWNTRDPLHSMAPDYAIDLANYFPESGYLTNRGGDYTAYTPVTNAYQITTLATLVDAMGVEKLSIIVYANSAPHQAYVYRYDSPNWTDITPVATFNMTKKAPWNTFQFNNRMFCTLYGYAPIDFGTTGAAAATAVTGAGLTVTNLENVFSYRGHLYYLEHGTANLWYLPLGYIAGTLSKQDYSSLLMKGGYLVAGGELSKQSDATNQNLFFLISSQGEILVFQGSDPDSPTWGILGRYFTGKPLGSKCIFYRGVDAHILTTEGIIPLNNIVNHVVAPTGLYQTISDVIRPSWAAALEDYPATDGYSWQAVYLPTYKMILVQPSVANDLQQGAYNAPKFVQNTLTGAWCYFDRLISNQWTVCNDTAYYISPPDSYFSEQFKIYEMDKPGTTYNMTHEGLTIIPFEQRCRQAFNFLDDVSDNKHITGIKAFFDITAASGHDVVTRQVKLGVDSDFGNADVTNAIILGDITANGTVSYKQVNQVVGEGTAFSILHKSTFGGGYSINWNGFIVDYELGGFES